MQKLFSLDGRLVKALTRFTDIIILNTLFIVCCLPVLTIGASVTALATMWHRLLKGEDTDLVFHFFRLFRANFKQATMIWLTCLGLSVLLYLDYCLFSNTAFLSEYGIWILLPFIGLFEDPTRKVCLNSFLIALLNPIQTIFLVFFNLAVIYISLSSPERLLTAIYLFTFGGFALWSFLNVRLTDKIFSRIQEGGVIEK